MKFNRERFMKETAGNLGATFDCIDDILGVLGEYIDDDEISGMEGYGCYGKNAESQVLSMFKNRLSGEYIDK